MRKNILMFTFLLVAVTSHFRSNSQKKPSDSTVHSIVSNHQILLTNLAVFKQHQSSLNGASAFLINYKDQIFAVTARHLLGEAGGIAPEISLSELNKSLISWSMFPRVPVDVNSDTVKVSADLNYDFLVNDILFLKITNKKFKILPLSLATQFPKKGDIFYIIGCPYDEPGCKQNIYPIEYKDVDLQTSTLICSIKTDVNLAGFSGAPIVDSNGLVVGVLVSGWKDRKTSYVAATLIYEVGKVRNIQK